MNKNLRKKIGQRVAMMRASLLWTQREFAGYADMTQRQVWAIERGKAGLSLESFLRVCKTFKMRPGTFLNLLGL